MKKLIITIIIIFAIGTTSSCLAKKKKPTIPPAVVEVSKVVYSTREQQLAATGTLSAIPGIVIKSEISGRITQVYFKSGDSVQAGAPIVEINPDIIKAQLAQAQASLLLTKLNYDRAASLYKSHDVSEADYDKARADYSSAQALVEQMQAQLRQTHIIAPFAGRLGLSQVNLGDYVSSGQQIVNLQSIDPIYVDFSIPEVYLSKVAAGQAVTLHTVAYPDEKFIGKIEALESAINPANRTLMLRASAPNKDGKLLPGAFVEVSILINEQTKVIEIPQTAVVFSPQGDYVFTVVDGKAVQTNVVLGDRDSERVIVKSGIKVGDTIVTAGQLKVHDGTPVVVANQKNDK